MKKEVLWNRFIFWILNKTLFSFSRKLVKKILGKENIPLNGPFIIAANHVSYVDPPLIDAIFCKERKYKVHFLASTGIKWMWWIFGGEKFLRWAVGIIPTPERRGNKAEKPTVDVAVDVLNNGGVLGVFPYPKFHPSEPIRVKTGIARMALWCKAPIVPVAIKGTYSVVGNDKPSLPKHCKKVVRVKIGKPFYLNQYCDDITNNYEKDKKMYKKVATKVVDKIECMLKEKW